MSEALPGVLLRGATDVHDAITNRELEISTADAGAPAHSALSNAGFLARLQAFVGVDDLAGAQNFRVDIATEAWWQIDVDCAGSDANVGARAAPAPRRNNKRD